jgi:plasmid stabilization system protein ParE
MIFTVVWKQSALDQLTELWMASENRRAVSAAANQIDSWLRHAPASKGESREGNERIMIVPPLVIVVEVHEVDRIVKVHSVRAVTERSP